MPCHCVVPNCRANYFQGPKVSVFKFPKNKELADIWIKAIKRQDFSLTKCCRVCELHFRPEDIRRTASGYDKKTGRTITASLLRPVLHEGVIPSLRLNCPRKTAPKASLGKWVDTKKLPKPTVCVDYDDGPGIFEYKSDLDILYDMTDVEMKVSVLNQENYWTVLRQNESILICHITWKPCPQISFSLVIEANFGVQVYCNGVRISCIGKYTIPEFIIDETSLETLLENMKKLDVKNQTTPLNLISVLYLPQQQQQQKAVKEIKKELKE